MSAKKMDASMYSSKIEKDTRMSCLFQCIDCKELFSLNQILYSCPKKGCGGLLDIKHDLKALSRYTAEEWRALFRERLGQSKAPYASGVWNKKEWVLPQLPLNDVVTLGEGRSPLIELPLMAQELGLGELWLKQCGNSHSASFKDLGMTVLVSYVKALRSEGHPIRAIACASTGDTSAALASYAAYAGIAAIVLLPKGKIQEAQLVQALSSAALVFSLDTDFDGCMKLVRELTQHPEIYLANSMNPLRLEGQKTMVMEVLEQLDWDPPDLFVIPGGNLGNVSALASGLRLLKELGFTKKLPRICVAQSANANPFYRSYQKSFQEYQAVKAKKTLASAIQIGDPVSYKRAVRALEEVQGIVEEASEEELANAAARVDRFGMFNDPHTGVALACLEKLCARSLLKNTDRVVVISTAHGLKFAESKSAYHADKLGIRARYANQPIETKADVQSLLQALEKQP